VTSNAGAAVILRLFLRSVSGRTLPVWFARKFFSENAALTMARHSLLTVKIFIRSHKVKAHGFD